MCAKSKVFAVLMVAAVSVTGFTLGMTAKAASWWGDTCPKCGEDSIVAEAVEYNNTILDWRPCVHGYEGEVDVYMLPEQLTRYYCGDCELYWEAWVTCPNSELRWHCKHDD